MAERDTATSDHAVPWWRGKIWLVMLSFALVGVFLLATEHRPHVLGLLPYLLLLACPLLHFFHGHGHRSATSEVERQSKNEAVGRNGSV
jgi:hypothetical protein